MIDSIAPILMTLCVNWLLVLGLKSLHIFKTKPMCPFQFGYICVWQITPHFAAIQCLGDDHIFIDGSRGQGIQVFGMYVTIAYTEESTPKSATCFLYEKMCWHIFVTCKTEMGVLIHNLNLLLVHMERMFRMTFVWTIAYNNRTFGNVLLKSPFHSIVVT